MSLSLLLFLDLLLSFLLLLDLDQSLSLSLPLDLLLSLLFLLELLFSLSLLLLLLHLDLSLLFLLDLLLSQLFLLHLSLLVGLLELSPAGSTLLLLSALLLPDLLDQLCLEESEHLLLFLLKPELFLLELSLLLLEPEHEVTVLLSLGLHDLFELLPAPCLAGDTLQLSPVLFQTLHDQVPRLVLSLLLPCSPLSFHVTLQLCLQRRVLLFELDVFVQDGVQVVLDGLDFLLVTGDLVGLLGNGGLVNETFLAELFYLGLLGREQTVFAAEFLSEQVELLLVERHLGLLVFYLQSVLEHLDLLGHLGIRGHLGL